MKGIIDLPAHDIFPIIFRNLSIKHLFTCRLVNKQFKYFSDHTDDINKLVIGQQNFKDYWYYNDQLINDNEVISLECFRSIKSLSIFNLDKNLKYLKICDHQLKLEEISNLINLEFLEFDYDLYYENTYYHQQIMNFNNLKVLVLDDLKTSFFPKFQYIRGVYVEEVDDVDGLSWFLNNLRNLTSLTIDHRSLDEAFYNNLPNSIKYLDIHNDSDIDYDFILKLFKLTDFTTKIDKDLFDLVFESFKNLKYLNNFAFYYDLEWIEIQKMGKYFYLKDAKLDYNQLVIECNKIRSNSIFNHFKSN